jgi:hypothetical protein
VKKDKVNGQAKFKTAPKLFNNSETSRQGSNSRLFLYSDLKKQKKCIFITCFYSTYFAIFNFLIILSTSVDFSGLRLGFEWWFPAFVALSAIQGCQIIYLHIKMPILVYLEGGGMENVGLFYGHLVFFSDSLHILLVPGKNLATLVWSQLCFHDVGKLFNDLFIAQINSQISDGKCFAFKNCFNGIVNYLAEYLHHYFVKVQHSFTGNIRMSLFAKLTSSYVE